MDSNNARIKLKLPLDKTILVNIASLEAYKGQKYLIEAMKKVLVIRQDIMLYIVGQGSLENSLQSLINKYGLQDNVILAGGNKPRTEIALWMNACDLFVLPSLSESFGIVQIEAMACGKPIICTDLPSGVPWVNQHGVTGLVVKPGDVADLQNGIKQLITNPGLARELGENGRRRAAVEFTEDRMIDRYWELFQRLRARA
jgi:rhamnosyl/mannosyltransferase